MGNILRYNRMRNDDNGDGNGNESNGNGNGNGNESNSKDEVLKPFWKYFALTGQYCGSFDPCSRAKQILYKFWQVWIVCLATLYFVYTRGIWGTSTKEYDIAYYWYNYPITTAESALYEFRWMVTCFLGILQTNGIWSKLSTHISRGNDNRRKKVKYFSWALYGGLIFVWALTVVAHLSEIDFNITRANALSVFADELFALLDRIIVFPLFFLFCITMYILCCMVEEYCENMEDYKKGENSARDEFRNVKAAIRIAGLSFEVYLMVHFLLLICTFFLGVCACFEQMEVRIAGNETVTMPFYIPHSTRYIDFLGNGNLTLYTGVHASQTASLLTQSYAQLSETQGKGANTGANNSLGNQIDDLLQTRLFKKNMEDVVVCMIIRTLESLLLYFVPISLMVRLQNQLRRVYEVIEDSNTEDQRAKEYLFNSVEVIRPMCKYVKTAHGLRIFGYTVPAFETFIIAAFGPFIAVVIQRLLSHIHMKK